jgi:hypothetical protein
MPDRERRWTTPVTIVDGRSDGVQPHSPSFDDTTHAWQVTSSPGRHCHFD